MFVVVRQREVYFDFFFFFFIIIECEIHFGRLAFVPHGLASWSCTSISENSSYPVASELQRVQRHSALDALSLLFSPHPSGHVERVRERPDIHVYAFSFAQKHLSPSLHLASGEVKNIFFFSRRVDNLQLFRLLEHRLAHQALLALVVAHEGGVCER